MKFYKFGDINNPVILLLPGTCCHWKKNFGGVIPLLESSFHVVCVSYDGFDETEQTTFPDMLTETALIERYVQEHFGGRICAAYGCSMGGSFVGLLIQRRKIHITHGILGSSDLDQETGAGAKIKGRMVARLFYGILQKGTFPGWLKKKFESNPNREYLEKMTTLFGIGDGSMKFVSKESLFRQFYSDLVTPLEDKISVHGTTVHIFYALKMGTKYRSRYEQHFAHPDLIELDLEHEELLAAYPQKWAGLVGEICLIGGEKGGVS